MLEKLSFFEQPICDGWIYPCTLEEIKQTLVHLPLGDLEGLWAVGLAASTRKDHNANGRYLFAKKPMISLYSFPASYSFKLFPHTKRHDIERLMPLELAHGMTYLQVGSRFVCRWQPKDLQRFILHHVLLHEVGHHVYHWQRQQQGLALRTHTVESEQFAEAYAIRMVLSFP